MKSNKTLEKMIEEKTYYDGISQCWSIREKDIKNWHIAFEKIHPFTDGNGRTGRILMNIQRLNAGHTIHVIYEKDKYEYYRWFQK